MSELLIVFSLLTVVAVLHADAFLNPDAPRRNRKD